MSYINEAEEAGMAMRRQFGSGAGAKKLNGTADRLLTALQNKNVNQFVTVLVKQYGALNMDVPLVFLEILKNERRFQEVANAFLLGAASGGRRKSELIPEWFYNFSTFLFLPKYALIYDTNETAIKMQQRISSRVTEPCVHSREDHKQNHAEK